MNEHEAAINNARNIIISTIEQSDLRVDFQCPTMVWDSTGSLYGVIMRSEVMMGNMDCYSEVSFVLKFGMSDEEILARVQAALSAISHRILAKIVPKEAAKQ